MDQPGRNANKRGPGVPCIDAQRAEQICAVVRQGMSLQSAADFVGVDNKTIWRHAKRDPQFAEALRQARSRCEFTLLREVSDAAFEKKDWRAATWILSHSFRDRYHRRTPGVPEDQVRDIFRRLVDVVLHAVPREEDRRRVMSRLRNLNGLVTGAARVNLQIGHDQ